MSSDNIKGRVIDRFPVYLEKDAAPGLIIVVRNINDVERVTKSGDIWHNRGPAPYEKERAVYDSRPEGGIKVSLPVEVFRIIGRVGNYFKLFPDAEFTPSSTWVSHANPRVGGYLIRHGSDYYTAMDRGTFVRQYAGLFSAADLKALDSATGHESSGNRSNRNSDRPSDKPAGKRHKKNNGNRKPYKKDTAPKEPLPGGFADKLSNAFATATVVPDDVDLVGPDTVDTDQPPQPRLVRGKTGGEEPADMQPDTVAENDNGVSEGSDPRTNTNENGQSLVVDFNDQDEAVGVSREEISQDKPEE